MEDNKRTVMEKMTLDTSKEETKEKENDFDFTSPFIVGDVITFPHIEDLWNDYSDNVWKIVRLHSASNGSVYADLESCYNESTVKNVVVFNAAYQIRFAEKVKEKRKKEWCCCVQ
jgi:hypothetical protein